MPRRRLYGTFVVAVLLAVIAAAGVTAPIATGQDQPRETGLRPANPQSQCAGRFEVWVDGRLHGCSHGYDPRPDGVDSSRDPIRNPRDGVTSPSTPGATSSGTTTAAAGNSTVCVDDGNSGPRVQAIYVFAYGADQSASVVPSIKAWAGGVDAVFNTSAAATGGTRHVRFVTDASCQPVVSTAAISTTDLNDFGNMIGALEALGFKRNDRKYLVWADTSSASPPICGIGEVYLDDQPGSGNLNNRGDMFARVDRPCWGLANSIEAHELMHTIGGVQLTAPHATTLNHCTDNFDRMCYTDGSGYTVTTVCASSALENQFDCNHDDYYYAGTPPAGTYLASHWNTAASQYLQELQPPPPGSTTFSVGSSSVAAGQTINVTWGGVNPSTPQDWIGLYPSSATANESPNRIAFQFTNGAPSGTLAFVVPVTTPPGSTYEFRHFWNNSYYKMGTAGPITVLPPPPPSLSGAPNPVIAGQSVNVTWSNIAAPSPYDWIGLYAPGVADNSPARTAFRFTNGLAGGTLPLTVPASATTGLYELRLFANNSYARLATSSLNVQGPPPPTVSGLPTPVTAGSTLNASWSGITSPMTYDWIGLYPVGAADTSSSRVWFFFTNAMSSGTTPMTIPTGTAPGSYELRLFANNSYTRLATPSLVTVQPAAPPAVSGSPTPVPAGQNVTVNWSGITSPMTYDWVGLYPVGQPDTSSARVWFFFTNATSSSSKAMTVPAGVTPGAYELRLFANNSFSKLATSSLSVQAALAPTVSGSPNPVIRGQIVNAAWANIAAPATYDWVGLYPVGAADNSSARVWFFFTNATSSSSKAMTVPAGIAPGTYELRLFANNSYTKLAASSLTIQ